MSDGHDHGHGDHEHHDHPLARQPRRRPRGSFDEWITNWREYDASTGTKLALAARNLFLTRWRRALMCCGHPGQPGC